MNNIVGAQIIADVIRDSGGEIAGNVRLQKTLCLLELSGENLGFDFEYHLYGPYCSDVEEAICIARFQGKITEKVCSTAWGEYSIFSTKESRDLDTSSVRSQLLYKAKEVDSVVLELAVTALFLAKAGDTNPWETTKKRKPMKADGRIDFAKKFYLEIKSIAPNLPDC